jgi:hypothetical protein
MRVGNDIVRAYLVKTTTTTTAAGA